MTANRKSIAGGVVWAAFVGAVVPGMQHEAWAHALLAFAALVIAPLALELIFEGDEIGGTARLAAWARLAQLPAAVLLTIACGLRAGAVAALAALPWVLLTVLLAVIGTRRVGAQGGRRPLGKLCADVALMFAAVGGAWTFADRAGLRPLNFEPAIVALTAVHFHYAGLLLPTMAGLVTMKYPTSRFASRAAVGVVLGVPAVAVGITLTQLGWGPAIECAAGWGLALSGMAVAILHVRLATENSSPPLARALLAVAGVSLFFGMLLAGLYALRAFAAPFPWLGIPWMRALHGTMNAVGFGLCGTLAWRLMQRP